MYVMEENDKIEDIKDSICFVIAKDGFYHKKQSPFFQGLTKILSLPGLGALTEQARPSFPRLPLDLLLTVQSFFKEIYDKYKSEVAVILYYNVKTNKWHVDVPEQEVGAASVKYDLSKSVIPKGFVPAGTIHSHASMKAFHSGTDDNDEYNSDGIHITIGCFHNPKQDYVFRLIFGKVAHTMDFMDVLCSGEFNRVYPTWWVERVSERKYATVTHTPYYDEYEHEVWGRQLSCFPQKGKHQNKHINRLDGIYVP
jgi:PRTRC genetic system protein A